MRKTRREELVEARRLAKMLVSICEVLSQIRKAEAEEWRDLAEEARARAEKISEELEVR